MKLTSLIFAGLIAVSGALAFAQAPSATIDPSQQPALAAAQSSLIQAFNNISEAQRDNDDHLGGHAGRAKQLLMQANEELNLAAGIAPGPSGNGPQGPSTSNNTPPPNLTGNWTIYAEDAQHPGSSLKEIQLTQNGSILTGNFHGPNQHGKLQGWVSGNTVEFSTDTRVVLTFHGQITSTGMSGFYSANGGQAPWNAQRSN
jgi:hypothetical protein